MQDLLDKKEIELFLKMHEQFVKEVMPNIGKMFGIDFNNLTEMGLLMGKIQDKLKKQVEHNVKKEIFSCSLCGKESDDEKQFVTDLNADAEKDGMTCEACYDEMNEEF